MARFGRGKGLSKSKKKALHARVKGRQNVRRKYLLPKRGLNQSSYEAGFFNFLDVFWNNSRGLNIYNLTKQVAKVWDALLARPKLRKKIVMKDYYKYKALQEAMEKQEKPEDIKQEVSGTNQEMNRDMLKRKKNNKKDNESGTEGENRSDFDEGSESDARNTRSRSDIESRTDGEEDSLSEMDSGSGDEMSRSENEEQTRSKNRAPRKQKRRKYESYEDYLRVKKAKSQSTSKKETEEKTKDNTKSGENQQSTSDQNNGNEHSNKGAQEGVFFPVRTETSFDRIVKADLDNQTELLKKLKICKPYADVPFGCKLLNADHLRTVESDDSLELYPSSLLLPSQERTSNKLMMPTNTLRVKNLDPGIKSLDLEEIFRHFLNDISIFYILENKYRAEAVVKCKSVEAAQNIWKQLNGVPYRKLPLILEFTNEEDD